MSNVTIGTTTDYRNLLVGGVEQLTFTNGARGVNAVVTASFLTGQISTSLFGPFMAVTGSLGGNRIDLYMNGSRFDMELFTFQDWSLLDRLRIFGSSAADDITGAKVQTQLFGGLGTDTLEGRSANDSLYGGDGHDSIEFLGGQAFGDDGNDRLTTTVVADVYGGTGDDQLASGGGIVDGGVGTDVFTGSLLGAAVAAEVDIRDGGLGRVVAGLWTVTSMERLQLGLTDLADNVYGGNLRDGVSGRGGDDTIRGQGGADVLWGGADNDVLVGGTGSDVLNGGIGQDVMTGGTGSDRFQFVSQDDSSVEAPDTITDFTQGSDKIDLAIYADSTEMQDHGQLRFVGDAAFAPRFSFAGPFLFIDDPVYEVRYEKLTNSTLVQIGYAEVEEVVVWQFRLAAALDLTAVDFIL